MQYNEEFIKGVTYGEVEELLRSGENDGFLEFLNEFERLASYHAQEILEGFIDDHFPENSRDCKTALSAKIGNLEPGECFSFTAKRKKHCE